MSKMSTVDVFVARSTPYNVLIELELRISPREGRGSIYCSLIYCESFVCTENSFLAGRIKATSIYNYSQ